MAARYSSRSSGSRPVAARYRRRLSPTRCSRGVSTGPLTVSHSPQKPLPSTVRLPYGRAARYLVRTRRSVPELHSCPSTRAHSTGTAWGRPRSSTVAITALWLASRKARCWEDRSSAMAAAPREVGDAGGARAATAAGAMAMRWWPQVASRAGRSRSGPAPPTTSPSGSSLTATPSLASSAARAASRSVSCPRATPTPRIREGPVASAAKAATGVTWSGMAAKAASTGSRASGPRTVRQAPAPVTVAPAGVRVAAAARNRMVVPDRRASSGRAGLASRPPVPTTFQPAGPASTRAPSWPRAAAMASASSLAAAPRSWLVPEARAAHSRARLVTLLLAGAATRRVSGPAGSSSRAAGRGPGPGSSATPGGGGGVDRGGVGVLVGGDQATLGEQVAELVGAVEQHLAGERVDREADRTSPGQGHRLGLEVDGDLGVWVGLDGRGQLGVVGGRQLDREQPVLEGVVAEDVGEQGSEHRLDPERLEGPGGVLPRRPRPEVGPGEQDRPACHLRPVEDEALLGLAVAVVAPVGEQPLAQPGLAGPLEEPGRDDLVGVDVVDRQGDQLAGERPQRLGHRLGPLVHERAGVGDPAGDGRGGPRQRAGQEGAPARALAA